MKCGISTASMFLRKNTEEALAFLAESKVPVCEIFLGTYSEYKKGFGDILAKNKGDVEVHSLHDLNTQFEPQLFSNYERARDDAFEILSNVLSVAQRVGAKYLTFHGVARLKKSGLKINFEDLGLKTCKIAEICKNSGVKLSFENVHWAHYNYPGFFTQLKKYCPELNATLDIKQARQSGYHYGEYIKDMAGSISTVHISDLDESGRIVLPGRGNFDFKELKSRLTDAGFDGKIIIEVYGDNYNTFAELNDSLAYIREIFDK